MNTHSYLARIVLYGLAYLGIFYVFKYAAFELEGETGFKLFFYISALSGIIQTINLAIVKKSEDVRSNVKLKYLQKVRLQHNLRERRKAAFARCIFGIGFSLAAAFSASAMNYYGKEYIPLSLLSIATLLAIASMAILFIALFEFKSISELEDELVDYEVAEDDAIKAVAELTKQSNSD